MVGVIVLLVWALVIVWGMIPAGTFRRRKDKLPEATGCFHTEEDCECCDRSHGCKFRANIQ